MVKAVVEIKQWGNSLGVRLPAAVTKAAHLHSGQRVQVSAKAGRVIVAPLENVELTLAQRLARFVPVQYGAEAMSLEPVGAERR